MKNKITNKISPKFLKHLPPLIQAARHGDLRTLDMVSRMISKDLSKHYPDLADVINEIIKNETGVYRGEPNIPTPIDSDSQLELVRVQRFVEAPPHPHLNPKETELLERFIHERQMVDDLAKVEEAPPSSILFIGPPGVGKTMSANWLSYRLNLEIVEVDLATVVSSYLGKTGQNLRTILDYSRTHPCILFLDEFDALAKKRDDKSDLGELKRIVNVLLKEIELWPSRGVLVAATNHPKLLDPAIWRRFDEKIDFSFPDQSTRALILKDAFLPIELNDNIIDFASDMLEQLSGSDIVQLAKASKRRSVTSQKDIAEVFLETLAEPIKQKWNREKAVRFINLHRDHLAKRITNVYYSKLFEKSEGTIRNMLKGR